MLNSSSNIFYKISLLFINIVSFKRDRLKRVGYYFFLIEEKEISEFATESRTN